jgi:SpoVK/Ycf46/Vps4 family AAA+-type ATPase
MATADQIKGLLKSHRDGDDKRFYAIALQVAAHASRQGHANQAREIKHLIDTAKDSEGPAKEFSPREPRENLPTDMLGVLREVPTEVRINQMVLDAPTREKLLRVILEQRQQHRFKPYGLSPRRKLLLIGPPGAGKTMTAGVLATELGLPLYAILLDGLINKYLGETASKLRLVFDAINTTRGVYFFDEFDALGARRDTENEVGEIRRVLNSFLQFIEQDQSESVVIAATNHIELLDPALFRRFDDVIEYRHPSDELILEALKNRLYLFETSGVRWPQVVEAARGLSYADIVKASEEAAKEALLDNEPGLSTRGLVRALSDRKIRGL